MAEDAKTILSHPLIQGYFKAIKDALISQWAESYPDELDVRENIHVFLRAVKGFENSLKMYVDSGKLAKKTVEDIATGKFQNL